MGLLSLPAIYISMNTIFLVSLIRLTILFLPFGGLELTV
ncbi:hypothetical protein FM107_12585 [Sphingobacterium sp. JB170]|nr:hypothetical protein FM107_12585 [Sphingobacterium sp. JB170]